MEQQTGKLHKSAEHHGKHIINQMEWLLSNFKEM